MPDPDALERMAEAAWKHRCDRMAEAKERPPGTETWGKRAPFLKEIDRSAASLVAAMAVHDAGLECGELRKFRLAILAHRETIIRGLVAGEHAQEWESQMKPFRDALEALGPLLRLAEEETGQPEVPRP